MQPVMPPGRKAPALGVGFSRSSGPSLTKISVETCRAAFRDSGSGDRQPAAVRGPFKPSQV
jgi:hypothetical protein